MSRKLSCVLLSVYFATGCASDQTPPTTAELSPVNVPPPALGAAGASSGGAFIVPMSQLVTKPAANAANAANGQGAPPMAASAANGSVIPMSSPQPAASTPSGAAGPASTMPTCRADGPCSHGTEPVIPQPIGECPPMVTGGFSFMGTSSQIWVGNKSETQRGPIMLYWHGTGGSALTATAELDPSLVQEIMGQGGMIGSIGEGLKGDTLDWGVFTTGDYQTADQMVACAVQQLNIDTKRIYASGASAGGLASGEIAYGRSSYVAGALPNSGGQGGYPMNMILQDPTHVPAVMTMHGARGVDVVVIDFGDSSLREDIDIAKKGGFAVDCDHGGGHVAAPADLKAAGWDFLKNHPFGFGTSPYANGLPASYPRYCMIVTKDTPMPQPSMSMMPAMPMRRM